MHTAQADTELEALVTASLLVEEDSRREIKRRIEILNIKRQCVEEWDLRLRGRRIVRFV